MKTEWITEWYWHCCRPTVRRIWRNLPDSAKAIMAWLLVFACLTVGMSLILVLARLSWELYEALWVILS